MNTATNPLPFPKLGQGTWHMGDDPAKRKEELDSIHYGLELGLTLIDTAEMYGNGRSESLIGEALNQTLRDSYQLVSKVLPENAGKKNLEKSLDKSLTRLKTDYLDLYLLHWIGNIPFAETVDQMEQMVKKGKIKRWGVSNFDTKDMKDLYKLPQGTNCQVNQVMYHLASRGIEYDLLPTMTQQETALMAYCPLAHGGSLKTTLFTHPTLTALGEKYQVPPSTILLAFTIQHPYVMAIPKAATRSHMETNAKAMQIHFTEEDLNSLNQSFPPPTKKEPLDLL